MNFNIKVVPEGGEESPLRLTSFERYREGLAICAVLVGDFAGHPALHDVRCGWQGHGAHHLVAFH